MEYSRAGVARKGLVGLMEILIGLLALGYLALPVIALIVALSGRSDRQMLRARTGQLAQEIGNLRDEISRLRARVAGAHPAEPAGETPSNEAPSTEAPVPDSSKAEPPQPETPQPETPRPEPVAMGASQEPAAMPAEAVAPRRRSSADLERAIGARWSVIVGGIAVALGAVFLVRYTIEAGLLGPQARIALGALFSAFLFGAGEWLRRRDKAFSIAAVPNADIPGILTGAGSVGAFAPGWAAYAVYTFIGPSRAFVEL